MVLSSDIVALSLIEQPAHVCPYSAIHAIRTTAAKVRNILLSLSKTASQNADCRVLKYMKLARTKCGLSKRKSGYRPTLKPLRRGG